MVNEVKFDVLPFGFCPECLDRMKAGELVDGMELVESGIKVLHAYCAHREVGAIMFVRPEKSPARWRMQSPIDALDWERSIAVQVDALINLRT